MEGERAISDCGIPDGRKVSYNHKARRWAYRFPFPVLSIPRSTSNHTRDRYTRKETTTARQVKYVRQELEPFTYGQELESTPHWKIFESSHWP